MSTTAKMTPAQKRRYEELQSQMKVLAEKQRLIVSRAAKQERKDATRRAIVTGQLFFAKAAREEKFHQALLDLLKHGVAENQQYLFPEIWPKAVRPARKRKSTEEDSESA